MPKKSKSNNKSGGRSASGFTVQPDTQRGILAILLLLSGLLTAFSLFGFAGPVGTVVNEGLSAVMGLGRYVVPIVFFLLVYRLLYPSEQELRPIDAIGLVLFCGSIFGMLDVLQLNSGGWVGLSITYVFRHFASLPVAVIVFMAAFLIAVLILFNTSLEHLVERIPAGTALGKIARFVVALFSSARERIAIARDQVRTQSVVNSYATDEADTAGFQKRSFTTRASKKKTEVEEDDEDTEEDTDPDEVEATVETTPDMSAGTEPIHLAAQHRKIDIPLDLLSNKRGKPTSGDIEEHKYVIHQTLLNFGIEVEMGAVNIGPTVTQYTFKPASGVKVSQVVALQNDLALALAAHPIRIEAPIPGKSLIGIEVPNIAAAKVGLRELLESEQFLKRNSNLSLLLGRDVAGQPYIANLANAPHMLIAGATGSGKSVCINTILLSLLYQNGPDDLKLILVDPKRVEFTIYNDIPHLLTPVVTDVQKTINALKWSVNEMDRRYEVLSHAKKRDIASYNESHPTATMPYIVFVIDELADLMASAPREVEAAIVRLAQMARAVGIHLVLATQRPSVDVITGLIKANITTRCAFNVASLIDSRTILDSSGAEKLLGRGDMLYINAESSKPKRVQGAFVVEEEITKVVDFLKGNAKADYDDEVINVHAAAVLPQAYNDSSSEDSLLPEAKKVIVQSQKASASLLQRRLRVGYARAARLLDILEEQGFIGPADGAKPREILAAADMMDSADDTFDDDVVATDEDVAVTDSSDTESDEDRPV